MVSPIHASGTGERMSEINLTGDTRRTGRAALLAEFWRHFSENKGAVLGLAIFVFVILLALLADVVAPHAPQEQYRDAFLKPPVWQEGGDWRFILGTDPVGRDILSRLIYGSRFSLFIGLVVVTISLLLGVTLGLLTGFLRGAFDNAVMRVMDELMSFPSLLLALVLVALLGPSLTNAMIAIALIQQPHYVRLTRAAVMSEMGKDYVTAARVSGVGGCAPRPRKPSAAASRIAFENPSVAWTMSGAMQFGRMVENISRNVPAPATRLAMT